MSNNNTSLNKAKKVKNDEFYTQLVDIENELQYYTEHFKNKIIYCNCDDPKRSKFWTYFTQNFKNLGIRKLISTHFNMNGTPSYILETEGQYVVETPLEGNGDFQSGECVDILKQVDIVVSNPPFSNFRGYVTQLIEHDVKFIIIGNKNAITYKEIFKLIQDNKTWLGNTSPKEFTQPDGSIKKFGNIGWFTNLETKKRHEDIILYKTYNPEDYPKYNNYDAINVDKVKDIPIDYAGCMGVPITFLDHFVPEQFEIIKFRKGNDEKDLVYTINNEKKYPYFRIIICNKRLGET